MSGRHAASRSPWWKRSKRTAGTEPIPPIALASLERVHQHPAATVAGESTAALEVTPPLERESIGGGDSAAPSPAESPSLLRSIQRAYGLDPRAVDTPARASSVAGPRPSRAHVNAGVATGLVLPEVAP